MKIVSTSGMKEWEDATIQKGISVQRLMQEAVQGCFDFITQKLPPFPLIILCGKGNNGNDGLLLSHTFREHEPRRPVVTILSDPPDQRREPPFDFLKDFAARCPVWPSLAGLEKFPNKRTIVIDALLGLGAKGAPRGVAAELLEWAQSRKRSGDLYVALDFPSGLDGDSGQVFEPHFPADFTCALGAVKKGCLKDSAAAEVGLLQAIPLSLSSEFLPQGNDDYYTAEDAFAHVKPLSSMVHKHSRGRVGVVAGAKGMTGAAALSCGAAFRTGAGFVKLYQDEFLLTEAFPVTEVVRLPLGKDGLPGEDFWKNHAQILGPGMGRTDEIGGRFAKLFPLLDKPAVLDADALYWLGKNRTLLKELRPCHVLTPHTGEMQGLLGHDLSERWAAAEEWTSQYPGVIVIKGLRTIVATRGKAMSVNATGGPSLATAGTGDVLSGVIGGLLAQGYEPFEAARLGVFLHGLASELSGLGRSMIASDLLSSLPKAWAFLDAYQPWSGMDVSLPKG